MRILYMGNNRVGWQVLEWLKSQREDIVGLVVHPPERQKYADEIIRVAGLPGERIFSATDLEDAGVIETIHKLSPDIALSISFGYVIRSPLLEAFPQGIINLHPSLLPYNRGAHPNVWSIVEGTPAGVSIHYVDEGIDTGSIIAQNEVPVEPVDTGETLYRKLERASVELFRNTWPLIKSGKVTCLEQSGEAGTYHRICDVEEIDEIDLDRTYVARELINILRARTFPPYKGAYFTANGKRVYMRLTLEYE